MRVLGFILVAAGLLGLLVIAVGAVRHWRGVDRRRVEVPGDNKLTVREVGPHTVEATATHYPTAGGYGFLLGGESIRRFSGPLRRRRAEAWLRNLNKWEVRSRQVDDVDASTS